MLSRKGLGQILARIPSNTHPLLWEAMATAALEHFETCKKILVTGGNFWTFENKVMVGGDV